MKTVILAMPPKLEKIGTHGDFKTTIKLVEGQDVVKQRVIIEDGGSHGFDNIERYFEDIKRFFEI